MNPSEDPKATKKARSISEEFGLPKGSFTAFLKQKEAALKRVEEAQQKHIREVRDCKLVWPQ